MNTKSFTLIEVLVALVILGILSTFIIISLGSVIDSSNDAKRKKDLDSVSKMLMTYGVLNGSYPIDDCNIGEEGCLEELSEYTSSFPKDPSGDSYTYTSDGTTYTIKAVLSNNQTLSYNPDSGYSQYQGLAGYTKRKSITLSNSGSALTDYQLKFTVYRSTGTDSGFDVYVSTNCQDDYDDIRFTNSSNTVLDYWIESSNASSATIWVEADSLQSGNTTMYLYYGNSSATTASNGNNTFVFFDHFEGTSLNIEKWTTSTGSVVVNGNSTVTVSNTATLSIQGIKSGTTFSSGYAIRTYIKINAVSTNTYNEVGFDGWGPAGVTVTSDVPSGGQTAGTTYDGGQVTTYLMNSDLSYHIFDIRWISSSSCKYRVDGGAEVEITTHIPTSAIPVTIRPYTGTLGRSMICDWILVRRTVAIEPSVSSWGSEESI